MRQRLMKNFACCGLLALATAAYAQDRDRDDRYRDEERYHQDARGDAWWHGHLFERVRDDIDHVRSGFGGDEYRLERVRHELDELQAKYVERGYDQPELDDVIGALQRVVADNRLSNRDRDMLTDDLHRLREFREHHEGYR